LRTHAAVCCYEYGLFGRFLKFRKICWVIDDFLIILYEKYALSPSGSQN
jgi:hypothetical protein